MKLNSLILLTVILNLHICFRSQTGFININYDLNRKLNNMKAFLPISLMVNAIDQYQTSTKELSYQLEACFLNLRAKLNFMERDKFQVQQRNCLNSYFEYFSVFEIMRSMVYKFFSDTCPNELVDTCTEFIEDFDNEAFSESRSGR